jgi:DNA-binding transcriptional regulator LsrR (DeoR family)
MKRSEVQIWINDSIDDCVELSIKLERAYGLDEAIVVPAPPAAMPTRWRRASAWRSASSSPKPSPTTIRSASAGAAR